MCGRYSFVTTVDKVKKQLGISVKTDLPKSYNIAPTQKAALILNDAPTELNWVRWGLIPHWANNESLGNNLINARSEDIASRPSFRLPIRHKRALVLADSFYEWQVIGRERQPFRFHLPDNQLMTFAGIYDDYVQPNGETLRTFAIITTTPNAEVAPVHDRMPVIFTTPLERQVWLSNDFALPDILGLLSPLPNDSLKSYAIGPAVGNVQNNSEDLHKPYNIPPKLTLF